MHGLLLGAGGSSIAFAADTRPCESFVEHSRVADLLVHEAYGLAADEAHTLGHATAAEAGKVARAAQVKRLVLTHLPANRFADPEEFAAEASSAFEGSVEAARDLDAFDF